MLESTVELMGGLILGVPPLLMVSCIVGSVVAALRALSRGNSTANNASNRTLRG
jgi:hypothetical protein